MGYLLIKDLDVTNLLLYETIYSHKLLYKTPYVKLNKIGIHLEDVSIKDDHYEYIVTINDKTSLQKLLSIDNFIQSKLHSKPLLIDNKLTLIKNDHVNRLIKQYKNTLDICIFTIKKNAYQCVPIVYVL